MERGFFARFGLHFGQLPTCLDTLAQQRLDAQALQPLVVSDHQVHPLSTAQRSKAIRAVNPRDQARKPSHIRQQQCMPLNKRQPAGRGLRTKQLAHPQFQVLPGLCLQSGSDLVRNLHSVGSGAMSLANQDAYSTGNTTKVKSVAVISPPITTMAKGRWVSEPMSWLMAMGSKPKAASMAVISTVRRRCFGYDCGKLDRWKC